MARVGKRTIAFRIIWLAMCRGGLGRLLSMGFIGAPAFIFWPARVGYSTHPMLFRTTRE